jgi:hypothetical protein
MKYFQGYGLWAVKLCILTEWVSEILEGSFILETMVPIYKNTECHIGKCTHDTVTCILSIDRVLIGE